jgi:hypothetical protein
MKSILSIGLTFLAVLSLELSVVAIPAPTYAQTTSTTFCYNFSNNLGEGRPLSSQDAQALTQALSNAGFWTSGTPITIYNDEIASAVSGFQEKFASQILTPNGLSFGTGYVGSATRAQLNRLYGCSTSGNTGTLLTTQCPSGWTCTPPSSSQTVFQCPTGWSCTPFSSTITSPIATPPVTTNIVTGTPPLPQTNVVPTQGVGLTVSLSNPPTVIKQVSSMDLSGNYTATYTASFNVKAAASVNAVLGLVNASVPTVYPTDVSIFKNSTDINGPWVPISALSRAITYSPPANTVVSNDGNYFTIGANQTVVIPVTVSFVVQNPEADAYSVVVRGVDWSSSEGGAIQYSSMSAPNAIALMTTPI